MELKFECGSQGPIVPDLWNVLFCQAAFTWFEVAPVQCFKGFGHFTKRNEENLSSNNKEENNSVSLSTIVPLDQRLLTFFVPWTL
jgi:hypothetical protein